MPPQTLRLLFHKAKAILFLAIIVYSCLQYVQCETCFEVGIQSILEKEACDRDDRNVRLEVESFGDKSIGYLPEDELVRPTFDNICGNSNLFCFPSTLPGYSTEDGTSKSNKNLSWFSDYSVFQLSTGQAVSCSSNSRSGSLDDFLLKTRDSDKLYVSSCGGLLHGHESLEESKQRYLDGSKSPHIEVSPPKLDWGQNSLYSPSFGFLTVANTQSDSNLFLYEPFSSNSQFYPCNFSEVLLKPGEVASICFVFLPTRLGVSTAHLVLKTSSGEFLIEAKGSGVESPYKVQLLAGPGVSSSKSWNRNLCLFNPFDETLFVEEVTVWVSVPVEDNSFLTKTVCNLETSQVSDKISVRGTMEWLYVESYQVGMPLIAMRPRKDWNIAPGSTEMIVDLNFLHNSEGNAFGAVYVKLVRASQGKSETIVVPLDPDLNGELTNHLIGPVLASLETLPNVAGKATVFALFLRNKAPYLLNVVKIEFSGEGSELFQIKYLEGLMLFPGTVTQVAVIGYVTAPDKILDQPAANISLNLDCKLIILTNDSIDPQVEVSCKDIVTIASKSDADSHSKEHPEKSEIKNVTIALLESSVNLSPVSKVVEAPEPDELVLKNWKSQATTSGFSILDHDEVIYPVVQVGTHHSKWITVRNPSPYPVLMQLVLNSGEIVGECKDSNGFSDSSSSSLVFGEYALQTRNGFSIAKTALTEAYVLPYESASFGPVVFHPTKRCGWRSSVLIRNNLSGVEWVYLRGLGGSFSLSLFEGSKAVQNIEFKFNSPLNLSVDNIYQSEETTHTCSKPLLKELYAKNTGDVPLHVRRIEVSGTKCGLDGFSVDACKGFSLEPGESSKLLISYRPDFSSVTVHRDLELALGSGMLVIPMKANLPLHMFALCKKSMFWTRLKRLSYLILFAAGLMLILFFYTPPLSMSLAQDSFTKNRKSIATVRQAGKSYNKNASSKMNGLLGPVGKYETLVASEQRITAQQVKPTLEYRGQVFLDHNNGTANESNDGNLTVRVKKEKGKRRRKKKGSVVGLTGIFEVSSSQSGNSTPSSPLSPLMTFTPKRLWPASSDPEQFVQKTEQLRERSLSTESVSKTNNYDRGASVKSSERGGFRAQEKPSPPIKLPGKPVLLQSATFPSSSKKSSPLVSTSTMAPYARAPGSKLDKIKSVESEGKTGVGHQFEYDIWGDHLFGSQSIDWSKKSYVITSNVVENRSDSFFTTASFKQWLKADRDCWRLKIRAA